MMKVHTHFEDYSDINVFVSGLKIGYIFLLQYFADNGMRKYIPIIVGDRNIFQQK